MFLSKVKNALIVVLVAGIAGSGLGLLGYHTSAGQPESKPSAAERKDRVQVAAAAPPVAEAAAPASKQETRDSPVLPDKLKSTIDYPGIEDARATLSDAIDMLSKRFNLTFDLNEKSFEMENLKDVARTPVADPTPLPPMRATLATVLRKILGRVPLIGPSGGSGATFIVRRDHIEITTELFVRAELGMPEHRPLLPLVWETLDNTQIDVALGQLARQSGYNIVVDPRVAEKLQTPATAEFNNVPVDTAVRLLANMVGMNVVRLDNVLYVTTPDNAKHLREEQSQINAEKPVANPEPTKKPAPEKPKK